MNIITYTSFVFSLNMNFENKNKMSGHSCYEITLLNTNNKKTKKKVDDTCFKRCKVIWNIIILAARRTHIVDGRDKQFYSSSNEQHNKCIKTYSHSWTWLFSHLQFWNTNSTSTFLLHFFTPLQLQQLHKTNYNYNRCDIRLQHGRHAKIKLSKSVTTKHAQTNTPLIW